MSAATVPTDTAAEHVTRYLDHLTVERGAAPNTVNSYRRDLARYEQFLNARGIDGLDEVATDDVREFLVELRRGDPDAGLSPLADSSIARTLVAVRGFHKFATAEGIVTTDVAHAVRPPRPARRLQHRGCARRGRRVLRRRAARDVPPPRRRLAKRRLR